jgi:hypothetical protein
MAKSENTVVVHVVVYRKAEGLHPQIAVTPEVLDLTGTPKGSVTVQWKLDTTGYRFPSERAVVFTSPGSKRSFGPVTVDKGGKLASAQNKNADGLAYAYNVFVVEEATGLTAVLDPIVQNRSQ